MLNSPLFDTVSWPNQCSFVLFYSGVFAIRAQRVNKPVPFLVAMHVARFVEDMTGHVYKRVGLSFYLRSK